VRRVLRRHGARVYVVIDAEGIVRFRTSGGGNREPVGLESAIKDQLKAAGTRSKSER